MDGFPNMRLESPALKKFDEAQTDQKLRAPTLIVSVAISLSIVLSGGPGARASFQPHPLSSTTALTLIISVNPGNHGGGKYEQLRGHRKGTEISDVGSKARPKEDRSVQIEVFI